MEQLDRAAGRPEVDLRPDQAVRHRVEEPVVLDVIVDADAGQPPLGELVVVARQRRQGRALDGLEQVAAGDAEAADDMIVDAVEGLGDGRVGLGQREEGLAPQAAEDAGLGEADPVLDLGLVLGAARPGRQDADAVVRGHHPVAAVELRIVERGLVDARTSDCRARPGAARRRRSRTSGRAHRSSPAATGSRSPRRR